MVDFHRCVRVRVVQTFQKNLFLTIFLNIQTHPPLLSIIIGFIPSTKVSMNSFVVRNQSLGIFVDFVLCIGMLTFRCFKHCFLN